MDEQTPELPDLSPVLKTGASARNIAAANKALAHIAGQGWEPLGPYPGSDTHWPVRCLLCDWEGAMFYSHMRRNRRHKNCLSKDLQAAAIEALKNAR
jgi:hypothetical protein